MQTTTKNIALNVLFLVARKTKKNRVSILENFEDQETEFRVKIVNFHLTGAKNNLISTKMMTYLRVLNEVQFDCCLNVCKAPSLLIFESPNSYKRAMNSFVKVYPSG